jgi:hypothetical protein
MENNENENRNTKNQKAIELLSELIWETFLIENNNNENDK